MNSSASRRLVAVLQARTTSSRLPGKALLPIAGMPSAVLAARRAGYTVDGPPVEVRLATSTDPTDDLLANIAIDAGLTVIRGSLSDPLERFVLATRDLSDDDVVARLTADNPVPDGSLIRDIAAELVDRELDYLRTPYPDGRLPYGVSVEVFTVRALRQAHQRARTPSEREHVTPWIRQHVGDDTFDRHCEPDRWSHLRATIDTFSDYYRMHRAFSGLNEPIRASWQRVCGALADLPDAPTARFPVSTVDGRSQSEMVLGTAQLGQVYGVANLDGLPDESMAQEVLGTALAYGVTHVDTGRAYGLAEHRVGRFLKQESSGRLGVVTKLAPLDNLDPDATPQTARAFTEASVFRSLTELGAGCVETLLLHRSADRDRAKGQVWRRLQELRDAGYVGRLGISVQSPTEALDALDDPNVRYLQVPINLLDARWDEVGSTVAARPDVTVAARSVLLQGLLSGSVPAERWPTNSGVDVPQLLCTLRELADHCGRLDMTDLSLAYVRAQPWVDALVVGAERAEQVIDLCQRFQRAPLTVEECAAARQALPTIPIELIDPAQWSFA